MKAMVLDFEATDTDASDEAQATQMAWLYMKFEGALCVPLYDDGIVHSTYCKPERPITYGAMATTHITPDDLKNYDSHANVLVSNMPAGEAYIIGHNIDFDIQVAKNAGVDINLYKAICTLAMARRIWPDSDSHSLGALSYQYDYSFAKANAKNAHDAAVDVKMCARLLYLMCRLEGVTDMESLYQLSQSCRIPLTLTFGKHKGRLIKDAATDSDLAGWIKWLLKQSDVDEYLRIACQQALDKV